jgi:hypothetical protein
VILIDALQTVGLGDWGMRNVQGMTQTGDYLMHSVSPTYRYFNYGDAPVRARFSPALFWLGTEYNRPDYIQFLNSWLSGILTSEQQTPSIFTLSGKLSDEQVCRFLPFAVLWYEQSKPVETALPNGSVLANSGVGIWRSAWNDESAFYVGVKGGENSVSHSHMDLGSFVMEAGGVRWAIDLGRELYNLEGMFDFSQDGKRWTYFRAGTQGHNTLMINGKQQNVAGKAAITSYSFSEERGMITLDLSNVYGGQLDTCQRTFQFTGTSLSITDQLSGLAPGDDVRWAMLTEAIVEVDGSMALLKQDGQHLKAQIKNPPHAEFEVLPAKPASKAEKQNEGVSVLTSTLLAKEEKLEITVLFELIND